MKYFFTSLTIVILTLSCYSQQSTRTNSQEDVILRISTNSVNTGFRVEVTGYAKGIKSLFLYLVVEDDGVQWIQPIGSLEKGYDKKGIEGNFKGYCYLGEQYVFDPNNLKSYYVYAIATTVAYDPKKPEKQYPEEHHPNENTIKKYSNKIKVTRVRKAMD